MITHHDVVLWGGLALMALGALVLLMIIGSMVAGLCFRLFMLTSGQASLRRRGRRRRTMVVRDREPTPASLARLLDGGAGETTTPIEVISDGR